MKPLVQYKWKKILKKCPTLFIHVGQSVAEPVLVKAGLSTEHEALRLQYFSPLKQGTFKEAHIRHALLFYIFQKKKKNPNWIVAIGS